MWLIGFPEPAEDLYDDLVDRTSVVHIEVPRDARTDEVVFEKFGIEEYLKRRHTKPHRRRLELALRLARRAGRVGEA